MQRFRRSRNKTASDIAKAGRGRPSAQPRREFLVIGLGRFGTSLAKSLIEHGHDVVAVDSDYDRVQTLSSELPHVIQIDASKEEALREIGADHFDTALVCIGYDFESNLLASVLVRRLGVRRVIAKARTRTQKSILEQVGVDEVILPEQEAGRRLAQRLSSLNFVDYFQLSGDVGVVEMRVPQHLQGKTLNDADLRRRYNVNVVALRQNGAFVFNLAPDMQLCAGDEMLVIGSLDDAERLGLG